MKDNGLVLSAQNNLAEVEVQCFAACKDCSAQSLCVGQSQSKGHVSAKNPLHAQPGDTVSLDIPETMYNKSLILVFGTLLSAALLGMAAGHFSSPVFSLSSPASGVLGLFLGLIAAGFWLFRFFRKNNNKRLFPVITEIINKGGHHG
ncbi:SoxR reducing system RseC family protein [Acidobacteriota bacterium]